MTDAPQRNVRLPILVPPRPASVHDVASRTDVGRQLRRNHDAVSVFALSLTADDLDLVVLALADGLGVHARGSNASVVAVEAFGDAFTRQARDLVTGPRWQLNLANAMEAAFADTNAAVLQLGGRGAPDPATALTVAVIIGDWLCAAHVGNSRVYRLADHELEQLTEDHAADPETLLTPLREDMLAPTDAGHLACALGVTETTTPSILFRPVSTGDLILVSSDGLHGLVEGDELARMLNASRPLEEIAGKLVAAARSHGGDDNISVALARIGSVGAKLPEPSIQAERLYGSVAASLLPRYQADPPSRWQPDRLGLVAGLLGSLVLLGGFVWWDDYRAAAASKAPFVTVAPDTSWRSRGDAPVAGASGAAGAVTGEAAGAARTPAAVAATLPDSVARQSRAADSVPAAPAAPAALAAPATPDNAATDAATRRRQVRDSVAAQRRADADEKHRIDSLSVAAAVSTRQAEEQRVHDSMVNAARQQREEQETRDRQAAAARAEQRARDEQAEREGAHNARVALGHSVLTVWLQNVVRAIDAGDEKAAALATGPARFAEFVGSNHPRATDAKMASIDVDEDSGEANAEWTLRWRTNFGTTAQRQMRVAATATREGESWRVVGWKILEGAP